MILNVILRAEIKVKCVLVIESEHGLRVLIRRALEDAGYFVASTTNGAEGLALLDKITVPSVILLDANIPMLNGEQFLAAI